MTEHAEAATEAALLAAIRADRADDAPRLVYADFLTERGDPRGEFIAVDCEATQRSARGDLGETYVKQKLRSWALLREHRAAFLSAMGLGEPQYTYLRWRRGFVAEVSTTTDAALDMAPALLRQPIELLQISHPTKSDVPALAKSRVLTAAPSLMLDHVGPSNDPLTGDNFHSLLPSGLDHIALCFDQFLGAVPRLSGIRSIRLGNSLGPEQLEGVQFDEALRELMLSTNRVPQSTYERLFRPSLEVLTTVNSDMENEGDTVLRAVATADLPRLHSLHVMAVSARGIASLLRAPVLPGLRSLRLQDTSIDAATLGRLFERAKALEELRLPGVGVDQNAVEAIARFAPASLQKLELDVSAKPIDLRPLVTGDRYALRHLELLSDGVNDGERSAEGSSPFADRLAEFHFAGPVTARGARALAERESLPKNRRDLVVAAEDHTLNEVEPGREALRRQSAKERRPRPPRPRLRDRPPTHPRMAKRMLVADPRAFRAQLEAWSEQPIARILVSHGRPISSDARDTLREMARSL